MEQLTTVGGLRDAILAELTALGAKAAAVLPPLLAAAALLLVGFGISWVLAFVTERVLRGLGLDRLAGRRRLAERAGLRGSVSAALGRAVFWTLLTVFLLASLHNLGLGAVSATIDRLVAFVPNLIAAGVTVLLGVLATRFAGSIAGSAAAAAGFPSARRLGFLVQALGIGLVAIVTLEQLGIATEILVVPFTVAVATAGLTAGLSFALGARPVITHILAGHFLKQSLTREGFVEIEGERGMVERVGPTDTLLTNGDKRWSVPNARLLEAVVVRTGNRA